MESTYFYKDQAAPVVFILLCVSVLGNCDTEIANGPIDTISFVGYPSQMNCTLSEYINNAAWAYLSDSNRPIGISLGDVVFNDAYELITNQTSGFYVYNLYIANVTTSINYVHLCEIYGSDPVVSKEAMLHVLTSGPFCELVPSRFVVADEEATFNCSVENGIPPGELVWYANETEVTRENSSLSNVWHPVFRKEDNGTTVNCHIHHESILPSAEEVAKCGEDKLIIVQYPPKVNITSSSRNVVFEGESFAAECKVEEIGYPPEIKELYWRGPNNEIYDTNSLMLENLTRELGGNYTCIASNEYADGRMGEGWTSLILEVQYAPSLDVKIHGNASEDGSAVEGDSFTVECIITDANPQPHNISWFDWKGAKVGSNELIEFNAVQRNESGNYTCKATNSFWDGTMGNATIGFSIFVQYIPEVNVTITGNASTTGRVIESHSFEAECEVLDSNPPYNNISWFDSHRTVVSPDGMVEFKDVRRKQSGDYTCIATNTFWDGRSGTGTAIMNVDVEYPPVASINDESDGRVVEGREYKSNCSSVANPAASFSWTNQSGYEINKGASLYLFDVKREESGMTYTCIATNTFWDASNGHGNDSITLDVQYNPDIELRDYGLYNSSQVIEGDDFSVLCLADSKPEVDVIAWNDSNADCAWLNFTSVERNDHGDYTCTAYNTFWDNSTGTGKERVFIDVQYPPSVNESTVFCVEHDSDVKISCEVDSNPSPSFYEWTRNGDLLPSLEGTHVIKRANRSDSGNYTCKATNVFYDETNATDSGVTKLTVQYLSDVTMMTTPSNNITEGSDVTIHCTAVNGNPNPYKTNLTFEGETIAETNGSALYHNLTSISREQDGNYKCNAVTQFYDKREDLSIDVLQIVVFFSARISSEESRVYEASVGDDVSMECTADGNPSPTIRWFDNRNESLSNDDDNIRIENVEREITSTLTVTLGSNSFGTYICEAYNWVKPSHYQSMTINEKGKGETNLTIIIIASACAGFLFLLLIIAIAVCLCRKTKKQDHKSISQSVIWTSTYDGVQLDSDFDRHDPDGLSNESDTMLSGEPLTFFANTEAEQSVSTDKTEKVDSDRDKVAENKEMTSDTQTMTRDSVSFLSFLPNPNMDGDIANQPTGSASSGQDSQKQQGEEQAVNPPQDNDGGQIPVPPPLVTTEVNDLSKKETVKTGDVMTYADLDLPIPSPQVPLPPKEETQYADLQFAQN